MADSVQPFPTAPASPPCVRPAGVAPSVYCSRIHRCTRDRRGMDLQARGQRRDLCAGHAVPEVTQDLFMLLITGELSKVAMPSSSCRTQITLHGTNRCGCSGGQPKIGLFGTGVDSFDLKWVWTLLFHHCICIYLFLVVIKCLNGEKAFPR